MAGKPISFAGADFVKHLQSMSTAVEKGRHDTLMQAAVEAKKAHLTVLRRDSGGDLKLSHVGRAKGRPGNAKIGARFDIKIGGSGKSVAVVKATGPVPIIANNTSGHVIRSAYSKGKARKGFVGPTFGGQFKGGNKAVLHIPGIGFRRSARHPGTRGKDSWWEGERLGRPRVAKTMDKEINNIIKRGFA